MPKSSADNIRACIAERDRIAGELKSARALETRLTAEIDSALQDGSPEDAALIRQLTEKQIALTLCPGRVRKLAAQLVALDGEATIVVNAGRDELRQIAHQHTERIRARALKAVREYCATDDEAAHVVNTLPAIRRAGLLGDLWTGGSNDPFDLAVNLLAALENVRAAAKAAA